jgi:hypothetical protein
VGEQGGVAQRVAQLDQVAQQVEAQFGARAARVGVAGELAPAVTSRWLFDE